MLLMLATICDCSWLFVTIRDYSDFSQSAYKTQKFGRFVYI